MAHPLEWVFLACGIMVLGGLLEDEARQRQAVAAEMMHEKLGRKTNEDMLSPNLDEASKGRLDEQRVSCLA